MSRPTPDRFHPVARVLLLAYVLLAAAACDRTPHLEGHVTDLANVFSVRERERLTEMLSAYEEETSHQLAVLAVPRLSGESIESFSLRVANSAALGRKGVNNGILVILAMEERRVRIELGLGFERYIPDSKAKDIIGTGMVPAFREGDYAGGIERGLQQLMVEGRRFVVAREDRTRK